MIKIGFVWRYKCGEDAWYILWHLFGGEGEERVVYCEQFAVDQL